MPIKPSLAVLFLLAGLLTGASQAQTAQPSAKPGSSQSRWDLVSAYPAGNFHTENLAAFARAAEQASAGRLRITLHVDASLFKAPEIKRAVQGNEAQLGEILLAAYQNEWPVFGLDALPFLADSYAAARKLYQAQKPALQKKLGEQGLLLLYAVPWPPQGLYSKQPLATLADLKGSKWRAYSPSTARIAELIGAQPVTVQAAELPRAMASGVVESFMSSGATGYDSRTFEHIKHYYRMQAWLPKNALLVNKKAFEALDPPSRQGLLKAAAEAEQRGWQLSEASDGEYLGLLSRQGMQILEPSAALKDGLRRSVGAPMLQEWLEKAGAEGRAIVASYRRP